MSEFRSLPARPSLEQLHKQAKELLRRHRAADIGAAERFRAIRPELLVTGAKPASLADAQFVLAREYGFESWPKLKHYIEALGSPGLGQFDRLAKDLAAAYTTGDATAIREINWNYGGGFIWDHDPAKMQRRLRTWFASDSRTPDLALDDARRMVARSYGFEQWMEFAESIAPPRDPRSEAAKKTPAQPFYQIDWKESRLSVRGPLSDRNWDTICDVMKEHEIARLNAGGITDGGMERVTLLDHVTELHLGNSNQLTDAGLAWLVRMPQLEELNLGGPRGVITDRGLEVLRHLENLKRFHLGWQQRVSDAGLANLAFCNALETVDLMGTPAGDGAIRALAGKPKLSIFQTGRNVTDAGLALLHQFPVFKTWQGGEMRYGLMSADAGPTHLLLDGPFTNSGLACLAGLEGLFGLSFFRYCTAFTSSGLEHLKDLPNLGFLGCQDHHCDDEAMRHIAALPRLRMLMGQGAAASDAGFAALSRSQTIEYIWGRGCPNLTGRGFEALAVMPALRGLAVSCNNVDDAALSMLSSFPALRELMPMDVSDDGFRHVGRCELLEALWCMYCRDTGDAATENIAGLSRLKTYYAGQTEITDRSLEILGRILSLERLEFWSCAGITNAGIAHLARLPRLREISLEELPGVSRDAAGLFPAHVRVKYSG